MGQGHQSVGRQARLIAVSGCGAKGPACFVVETRGKRIMLDLGYGPQPGLWPNVERVGKVDALLLSHAHRDHAGGLALRANIGNPPVFAMAPAVPLLPTAIGAQPLPLVGDVDVLGIRVRTGRNGHSPGGAWLHLEVGSGFVYMGDHSVESLIYAYDPPPPAATLVLDASYGTYDQPLAACIAELEPVFARSHALFPIPVAGRGPEMVFHLARTRPELPCIGDDLRSSLIRMVNENADSLHAGVIADLVHVAREAPAIADQRGLLFTGYADATEGVAAQLVAQWESQPSPEIIFSGYLPPGTLAARLVNSGRARYLRWNVHPRLSDNAALVRAVGATTVVPAFCERKQLAALSDAFAPARVTMDTPLDLP